MQIETHIPSPTNTYIHTYIHTQIYSYQADPLGDGAVLLHLLAQLGLDAKGLLGRPWQGEQSE